MVRTPYNSVSQNVKYKPVRQLSYLLHNTQLRFTEVLTLDHNQV